MNFTACSYNLCFIIVCKWFLETDEPVLVGHALGYQASLMNEDDLRKMETSSFAIGWLGLVSEAMAALTSPDEVNARDHKTALQIVLIQALPILPVGQLSDAAGTAFLNSAQYRMQYFELFKTARSS